MTTQIQITISFKSMLQINCVRTNIAKGENTTVDEYNIDVSEDYDIYIAESGVIVLTTETVDNPAP